MATTKRKRTLKSPNWRLWQVKMGEDGANIGKPILAVSERQAVGTLMRAHHYPYRDNYFAIVVGKPKGLPAQAPPTKRPHTLPSATTLAARNPHYCGACGYHDPVTAVTDDCPGCGEERFAA